MAKYAEAQLTSTFAALVDPTRRAILVRLETEPNLSISEIARPLSVKLPGVMKHLDVLSEAKLISRTKTGRTVQVKLTPGPMKDASAWLRHYERFWSGRLDRLAAVAEREEAEAGKRGK